jgi:signal-transduction protein with cAMP-binding, CBS, and nucleotidyltransferase domain
VKKVKLSKALTIPDGTTVTDACRRMAARRVDAVLLTDSSALLSGILTDKVAFYFYISITLLCNFFIFIFIIQFQCC